MSESEEIHEPFGVTEIFAEAICDVFRVGDIIHMSFCTHSKLPGLPGIHKICIAKMAITADALQNSRDKITRVLASSGITPIAIDPVVTFKSH